MKIETCVNVSNEILFDNVLINSKRNIPWIKSIPEHDNHAVIVGGGPSCADWLEEIKWRQSIGQTIFALNGVAKYLSENGIIADYTVVLDARPQNLSFIGYAKSYLLASQCDPSLFYKAAPVSLWHQDYPENMKEFDASLPPDSPEHSLIGGGTTVGLSSLALVYALGYRKLHLYGYDSSFRDENGHAYAQTDDQGVTCINTVEGRAFKTTLAMAQQAELFPTVSDMLIDAGCFITIRGDGLLPWISQLSSQPTVEMTEQEKYQAMWDKDIYRIHSPGEDCVDLFINLANPTNSDIVYDFGCGTGRASLKIAESCNVQMFDLADNCLDQHVREKLNGKLKFDSLDIVNCGTLDKADYAYCTDVLEHIPPEDMDKVLNNILTSANKSFLQISLVHDNLGALINQHLHLSVHPFGWWEKKLKEYGNIEYSQDNVHNAIFFITT